MSAAGIEPATNGLKGQSPVCASPIQKPAPFAQYTGRYSRKVSWMLLLRSVNTSTSNGLAYQRMNWWISIGVD